MRLYSTDFSNTANGVPIDAVSTALSIWTDAQASGHCVTWHFGIIVGLLIDECKLTVSHTVEYNETESCSQIRSTEKVASAEEKSPINGP